MKKRWNVIAATVAAVVIALTGSVVRADNGNNNNAETRLKAKLTGPAISGKTPEGSADFRMDSRGRSRLNVEVEHVNLAAGTMLTVSLTHAGASSNVGSIKLSALGGGEIELNSQDGDAVRDVAGVSAIQEIVDEDVHDIEVLPSIGIVEGESEGLR